MYIVGVFLVSLVNTIASVFVFLSCVCPVTTVSYVFPAVAVLDQYQVIMDLTASVKDSQRSPFQLLSTSAQFSACD